MKLMVASDIHGSAYYCERLIDAYKKERPEKLMLLGDILYHGPRNDLPKEYNPKAVIKMLNEIKESLLCVRGNCDTEVDQMVLQFPIMADYAIIYLSSRMIYATHGHIYNLQNLPPMKKGDIILHGHTHVPAKTEEKGIFYLNPGSVSIPKENSHHGYMVLEENRFIWKNLEMDEMLSWETN